MTNTYIPDGWEIIFKRSIGNDWCTYFVFGSWSGGYLYGDNWRRNSGITEVKEDDSYYYFYGNSGSVYKCHKDNSNISSYGSSVLGEMLELDGVETLNKELIHETFKITKLTEGNDL